MHLKRGTGSLIYRLDYCEGGPLCLNAWSICELSTVLFESNLLEVRTQSVFRNNFLSFSLLKQTCIYWNFQKFIAVGAELTV